MNPRSFLVRGLLVGLVAGLLAFAVAFVVGEPHVERAIELEESAAAPAEPASDGHSHSHSDDEATAGHSHGDEAGGTSRETQRTWGLLTATVAVGVALGGLVGLVSAAAAGRLGRLSLRGSTLVVAGAGFVATALVPWLKYPPNPPAVGSGETIGSRTALYFGLLALSVLAAWAAVLLARRVAAGRGAFDGVLAGVAAYVVAMMLVTALMPAVDELGDFPASTLWAFRLASLLTLATTWAVIGLGLAWSLGRVQREAQEQAARRELAASL
ncbi:CbtA family protein [Nocardioides aequoreus]|uniref:CbtA family protein n=1 Tax=Nocardioides aequoreus TaxID=397278 RepID=UPI0004C38A75|nr:CbtA family protein [Nocardioides aequoreus]